MESNVEVPQKLKIELPYNRAIPLLGIYLKEYAPGCDAALFTPVSTAALFTILKLWKEPGCPTTDEWVKKIYTMELN
jgi:hypothetical protein